MVFKFSISFLLWECLFSEKSTPLATMIRHCCLSFGWARKRILSAHPERNVQIYRGFWISSFLLSWINWRKWSEHWTRWRSSEEELMCSWTRGLISRDFISSWPRKHSEMQDPGTVPAVFRRHSETAVVTESQLFFYIQKVFNCKVGCIFKWCFHF